MLRMAPWEIVVTIVIVLAMLLIRWIPGLPGYNPEPERRPRSPAHSREEDQHSNH